MRMLPFTAFMLSLLSQSLYAAGTVTVHRTDSGETLKIRMPDVYPM